MKDFAKRTLSTALGALLTLSLAAAPALSADDKPFQKKNTKWTSGDFHQHTLYTDGSTTFDFVMGKSNEFDLDWWANSEHGGGRNRDGNGLFWDARNPNPIVGCPAASGGHQIMWRWQSLRDFVYPDILRNRSLYPEKKIFSGFEWNVPGHEHCSTGIVADDASAISAFEYMFDASDNDISRNGEVTPYGILQKMNGRTYVGCTGASKSFPDRHADAVRGCAWMQDQYKPAVPGKATIDNGWIVFAHIERDGSWNLVSGGGYNVEHFRDFNNAGPDVCFGFEGAPGHQVNNDRGFGNAVTCDASGVCTSDDFGGTYGGAGFYTAKVGGLWDALLGEGRRWFNFASSDYHRHYTAGGDDFFPGEYQKNWVKVVDTNADGDYDLNEIANGLRSGNVFHVMGDLISVLEFNAKSRDQEVEMGGELKAGKPINNLQIKIRFKSPVMNNCAVDGAFITSCVSPVVDHIDLIAGEVTGKVDPSSPEYMNAMNPTAKVIASFTGKDWEKDDEGYNVIVHHIKDVNRSMYFRLRGTNVPCGTEFETNPATPLPSADYCSPLADALVTQNIGIDGAQEAWNDLWFYSNPIFVYVK